MEKASFFSINVPLLNVIICCYEIQKSVSLYTASIKLKEGLIFLKIRTIALLLLASKTLLLLTSKGFLSFVNDSNQFFQKWCCFVVDVVASFLVTR